MDCSTHFLTFCGADNTANYWSNPAKPGLSYAGVFVDPLGFVHLQGFATEVGTPDSALFYLPPGDRPSADLSFPADDWSSGNYAKVDVFADGLVLVFDSGGLTVPSGNTVSLSGVSFHP